MKIIDFSKGSKKLRVTRQLGTTSLEVNNLEIEHVDRIEIVDSGVLFYDSTGFQVFVRDPLKVEVVDG